MPERYAWASASATVPRKFPTPYGSEAVKFAERPKKLRLWNKLKIGTLSFAVASVIGTEPSKIRLPVENE